MDLCRTKELEIECSLLLLMEELSFNILPGKLALQSLMLVLNYGTEVYRAAQIASAKERNAQESRVKSLTHTVSSILHGAKMNHSNQTYHSHLTV